MALHLQTFKTRLLTALIFVIVMLAGLLWNFWSFVTLFAIIHFGCWYEFIKLMKKIYGSKYLLYSLFGLLYITLPLLLLIHLRGQDRNTILGDWGWMVPLGLILSIWINDTMAYLVGSWIGRTPLSTISPKKTWEGTIGGTVLCIAIMSLLGLTAIAAIAAVFGTLGDLLESKLKRAANVKDSGTIMPGHGGFLDRFDSLLIATPFVWIYVSLFM
jgi:phosphatidate cytidylyltransferase